MEILITGCERSGTKMLSEKLGEKYNVDFNLENKHTIACFKYYQELQRWNKYKNDNIPLNYNSKFEKHTLNEEINIEFLKWVKQTFPNVKIYYIVRDGRNVVSSIISKMWGHTQTKGKYKIGFEEACVQWNSVIEKTWDWAIENATIVRYEDYCDIVSNPLDSNLQYLSTERMYNNLKKTKYIK